MEMLHIIFYISLSMYFTHLELFFAPSFTTTCSNRQQQTTTDKQTETSSFWFELFKNNFFWSTDVQHMCVLDFCQIWTKTCLLGVGWGGGWWWWGGGFSSSVCSWFTAPSQCLWSGVNTFRRTKNKKGILFDFCSDSTLPLVCVWCV